MKNQKWKKIASIFMVTAMLGTSVPSESNATVLLFANFNKQLDKSNYWPAFGSLGVGIWLGAHMYLGTFEAGVGVFNYFFPEDGSDPRKLTKREKAGLVLGAAAYIGLIVLDEQPVPVKGAKTSSFSLETLEMTYTPEEALQINKDMALLDQQQDKTLIKFSIPVTLEKKVRGQCDAECKKTLPQAEAQFLKEVTQKLSEQASEISRQSYQVSELTSRHLLEIATGYSFESVQ